MHVPGHVFHDTDPRLQCEKRRIVGRTFKQRKRRGRCAGEGTNPASDLGGDSTGALSDLILDDDERPLEPEPGVSATLDKRSEISGKRLQIDRECVLVNFHQD
jgi:hypothetical protein